jgi:predicted aldo/keto reductase-like oxidoreductase
LTSLLCAHNYGQDPAFYERFTKNFDIVANQVGLPRLLEKAHAKGVGVLVMKTLMGARLNDMKPYERAGSTFSNAAFRWVLSNPNIDGLAVSMTKPEQIDEYLVASGDGASRRGDIELLRKYAAIHSSQYCRPGCDACLTSCPESVQISEVLRARMYKEDYADIDAAKATYAELKTDASACTTCLHESCANACPFGLKVSTLLRDTADSLASS